jgi:hypothetical protein
MSRVWLSSAGMSLAAQRLAVAEADHERAERSSRDDHLSGSRVETTAMA